MARRERTPALRALEAAGIEHRLAVYPYVEAGGTRHAADHLGLDEHAIVKTLVFEADGVGPVIVLMHGDRRVSARALARVLGVRRVAPCDPTRAERITGYRIGGTSPFGTRRALPVLVERSVLDCERVWLNGGRRGLLVEVDPRAAVGALHARIANLAESPAPG